jgi:ABC-type dipeptide/oligopeptide/nickel transport system permease subunit
MRVPLFVMMTVMLLVLLAPLVASYDPMQTSDAQLQPPGGDHLLGTDLLGRDVLSRALFGGRRTLLIAFLATMLAVASGTLLGLLAGTVGGKLDATILSLLNAMLAFPSLVLALVVLTLLGAGIVSLAVATGMAQVASYARVTRSAVIAVRSMGYVEVAHALGATRPHIMSNHILPNIGRTLLAYAGVVFSYTILNAAALTFLGLGGEPGIPDWGVMLAEGRTAFRVAPWIGLVPGLLITVTVWAVNRLADLAMDTRQ